MSRDLLRLAQRAHDELAKPKDERGDHETGLAEGSLWETQLRKGCRFLAAAQHCNLRPPKPGFYMGVVELSFSAVERTVQAILMRQHGLRAEDFQAHMYALREAGNRDLVPYELARALEDLWLEFRNENYYRSGIPGSATAGTMLQLAEELHRQLVARRAEFKGACICRRRK